jgi:hypothetical protein
VVLAHVGALQLLSGAGAGSTVNGGVQLRRFCAVVEHIGAEGAIGHDVLARGSSGSCSDRSMTQSLSTKYFVGLEKGRDPCQLNSWDSVWRGDGFSRSGTPP